MQGLFTNSQKKDAMVFPMQTDIKRTLQCSYCAVGYDLVMILDDLLCLMRSENEKP